MKSFFNLRIIFLCLISSYVQGQYIGGARIAALGHASSAISDPWNVFFNPAGFVTKDNHSIVLGASIEKIPQIDMLKHVGLVAIFPNRLLNTGVGFQQFGFEPYSEQRITLGFEKIFGSKFHYGFCTNYHRVQITNYGYGHNISVDVGIQYDIKPNLKLGVSSYNIGMTRINGEELLNVPAGFRIGTSWLFVECATLCFEYDKKNTRKPNTKFALEYQMVPSFVARAGINTEPSAYFFGIGYQLKDLIINFSIGFQPYMFSTGYYPQSSVMYEL